MKIIKLLHLLNDEQNVIIGSDWGDDREYEGKKKDITLKFGDDVFYSIFKSIDVLGIKDNTIVMRYHIYDSHASNESNFVPVLGLDYVSLLDILLVLSNENTVVRLLDRDGDILVECNPKAFYVSRNLLKEVTSVKVENGILIIKIDSK